MNPKNSEIKSGQKNSKDVRKSLAADVLTLSSQDDSLFNSTVPLAKTSEREKVSQEKLVDWRFGLPAGNPS